ncbi:MAG: LytTR family DNA-binding domain-containing protein [Ruminococcus flavefaciens]|nr:LytTR family DNA-binding domain-containing protein [Ruminococcus flavefaciens]
MIKIAICDDNTAMKGKLESIISAAFSEHTDDFVLKSFSNGILLMNEQEKEPFDVIFLDIDMPKMSGFDVAKLLRESCVNCFLIFVTNYSELIYEGMDFQPFHFIRKNCNIPIDVSVSKIVKNLMKHMKQNEKIILEDNLSRKNVLYIHDIVFIESDKHYLFYHILNKDKTIKLRGSLKECEDRFDSYDFVRINKRYYVNLRYVSDLDFKNNEVIVHKERDPLPLGKNYKENVGEKYTLYLRKKL